MDCLAIEGGIPLAGTVAASGAKNAALPIMAAALLAEGPVRLTRVPRLADVATLGNVLASLGAAVQHDGDGRMQIDTPQSGPIEAKAGWVRRMRASFCVLGPLLARRRAAIVALPGGCRIGARPVDLHLAGLAALGADIEIRGEQVIARAERLRGATIRMTGSRGPTVTGTANVLCAASRARGTTAILGAAREPEIVDLGHFLTRLGARIEGLGSDIVEVRGVEQLATANHEIIADRIEAATLLLAGAITGGGVTVTRLCRQHLAAVLEIFDSMGQRLIMGPDSITTCASPRLRAVDLRAAPYPGLPTDLQAQFTALLSLSVGQSSIRDEVFPVRFQHLSQLARMGAHVRPSTNGAEVRGVAQLSGADLQASDLRASAALVLAGLAAQGSTRITGLTHLDRGYEGLEIKLAQLRAAIERVPNLSLCPPMAVRAINERAVPDRPISGRAVANWLAVSENSGQDAALESQIGSRLDVRGPDAYA